MTHEDHYREELTQKSFVELENLAKWLNIHAFQPVVIGGWSTFYYVKGLGSRDIDLVIEEKALPILEKYCAEHGYSFDPTTKTRFHYSKMIGKEKIDIDVFTFSHKNKLAKDHKIEVPWALTKENNQEWKVGDSLAKVPTIELLLLYKAAALIDRKFKLEKWVLQPVQKQYLNAKIWKDVKDIQALLQLSTPNERLEKLLDQTKFKKEFEKAINEI